MNRLSVSFGLGFLSFSAQRKSPEKENILQTALCSWRVLAALYTHIGCWLNESKLFIFNWEELKVETLPLLFLPKRLSHFYSCLREFVFSWLKDLFLPAATERKWKARIEEESLNIFMFTSRSFIIFILAEGFFIFAGEVFIFAFRRDFLFLSWRIESGVTQPWVQRHEELSFQMLSKILTSQIKIKMMRKHFTDWNYFLRTLFLHLTPLFTIFNFWKLKTAELKNGTLAKPKWNIWLAATETSRSKAAPSAKSESDHSLQLELWSMFPSWWNKNHVLWPF